MVAPHPDWSDTEDGYRNDNVGIFVEPASLQTSPGTTYHRSGGITDEEANAYAVELRSGMETASHTWDVIAHFTDARTAWEFANLLTHYFDTRPDARSAKTELLGDDPTYPGDSKDLPQPVEDYDAFEAFLTLLHPGVVPEPMRELFDEKHKL